MSEAEERLQLKELFRTLQYLAVSNSRQAMNGFLADVLTNVKKTPSLFLIAPLRFYSTWRDQFEAWPVLLKAVEAELVERDEDATKLLRGLL